MNRLAVLALCLIGACSYPPERVDTSGRHPTLGDKEAMTAEAKEAEVDTGRLVVHSPAAGYSVYTEDGHLVAHEDNDGGRREGPAERKLAPGRYFVRLDEPAPGRDFWVIIEKGKVTDVRNPLRHDVPPTVK